MTFSQAIAHYEQAADYYKGEESTRYGSFEVILFPCCCLILMSEGVEKIS